MITKMFSSIKNFFSLHDEAMLPLSDNVGYYNDMKVRLGTSNKKWQTIIHFLVAHSIIGVGIPNPQKTCTK